MADEPKHAPPAGGRTCLYPDCLGKPLTLSFWRVRDLLLLLVPALFSLVLFLRTGIRAPLLLFGIGLFLTVRAGNGRTLCGMLLRLLSYLVRDRKPGKKKRPPEPERAGERVCVLSPLGLADGAEADGRVEAFARLLRRELEKGEEIEIRTEPFVPDVSESLNVLRKAEEDPEAGETLRRLARETAGDLGKICGPVSVGALYRRKKDTGRDAPPRSKTFPRDGIREKRKQTDTGRTAPESGQKTTLPARFASGRGTWAEADTRPGPRSHGNRTDGKREREDIWKT